MPNKKVSVVKSDGSREFWNEEKLHASLTHAGADEKTAREIVGHVTRELIDGIRTDEIYRHAFALLRKSARPAAARYSLRRAVLELGPTGFPFERYIAELYRHRGFSVLLDQTVVGKCVSHEIDVVAWNAEKLIMVEAKYHHDIAHKSDLKVALYVKARFEDLLGMPVRCGGAERRITDGLLITNTKFTERAIQYSACAGVKLIGWNYPAKGNLHDLIQEAGVHPITSLSSFSATDKRHLMEAGVILCRDLRDKKEKIAALGISPDRLTAALSESARLCPM